MAVSPVGVSLLALLVVGWLVARLFPARPRARFGSARRSNDASHVFKAVSIRCGSSCCKEAEAIRGERLLIDEVPTLPLVNCTSDKCSCTYIHHLFRRTGNMRSTLLAGSLQ